MHRAQNTPSNVTLAAVSILCSLSFIRQKLAEKPKKLFDELSNEHTFGGDWNWESGVHENIAFSQTIFGSCIVHKIIWKTKRNLLAKRNKLGEIIRALRNAASKWSPWNCVLQEKNNSKSITPNTKIDHFSLDWWNSIRCFKPSFELKRFNIRVTKENNLKTGAHSALTRSHSHSSLPQFRYRSSTAWPLDSADFVVFKAAKRRKKKTQPRIES